MNTNMKLEGFPLPKVNQPTEKPKKISEKTTDFRQTLADTMGNKTAGLQEKEKAEPTVEGKETPSVQHLGTSATKKEEETQAPKESQETQESKETDETQESQSSSEHLAQLIPFLLEQFPPLEIMAKEQQLPVDTLLTNLATTNPQSLASMMGSAVANLVIQQVSQSVLPQQGNMTAVATPMMEILQTTGIPMPQFMGKPNHIQNMTTPETLEVPTAQGGVGTPTPLEPTQSSPQFSMNQQKNSASVEVQVETPKEKPETLLLQQHQFQSHVAKVKQEQAGKPVAKPEPISLDKLQQEVDQGKFLPIHFQSLQGGTGVEQVKESNLSGLESKVIQQVEQAIQTTTSLKQSELTMKLKPEGLGEITVKMVQGENKLLLNISTSNKEVGQLISAELGKLQESLKTIHGQMVEITTADPKDTGFFQQNSQFQQNFGQQKETFSSAQQEQGRRQSSHTVDVTEEESGNPVEVSLQNLLVDTYI